MALSQQRLKELAAQLARQLEPERDTPRLRLVPSEQAKPRFDSVTRDSHLTRVRYLARAYNLQWIVDQATFGVPALECLSDDGLIGVHRDLDRAVDCIREGIPFDDAGLVREQSDYEGNDYDR